MNYFQEQITGELFVIRDNIMDELNDARSRLQRVALCFANKTANENKRCERESLEYNMDLIEKLSLEFVTVSDEIVGRTPGLKRA